MPKCHNPRERCYQNIEFAKNRSAITKRQLDQCDKRLAQLTKRFSKLSLCKIRLQRKIQTNPTSQRDSCMERLCGKITYTQHEIDKTTTKRRKLEDVEAKRDQAIIDRQAELQKLNQNNTCPTVSADVKSEVLGYGEYLVSLSAYIVKDPMQPRSASNQKHLNSISNPYRSNTHISGDPLTHTARMQAFKLAGVCVAFRNAVALLVQRQGGRVYIIPPHQTINSRQRVHVSEFPVRMGHFGGVPTTAIRRPVYDAGGVYFNAVQSPCITPTMASRKKSVVMGGVCDRVKVLHAFKDPHGKTVKYRDLQILPVFHLDDMGDVNYPGSSAKVPMLINLWSGEAYVLKTTIASDTLSAVQMIDTVDCLTPHPLYFDGPLPDNPIGSDTCQPGNYHKGDVFASGRTFRLSTKDDDHVILKGHEYRHTPGVPARVLAISFKNRPTLSLLPLNSPLLKGFYHPTAE